MQQEMKLLVCHAADGHFADGDRAAIRRVLARSERIAAIQSLGHDCYAIVCTDGGRLQLCAPGLSGTRPFHRIELYLDGRTWSEDLLSLIYEMMCAGGFGLVDNLAEPQFVVTDPRQIAYYPWLPEPPLLVRSAQDLAATIGQPVH